MMLFIAIKAIFAVLIGFHKKRTHEFFLRSSSKLDDFPLKTASGLVFNNNLCFCNSKVFMYNFQKIKNIQNKGYD